MSSTVLGRHQDGDVPADDLVGGVAEDPLGAPVPARDDAVEGLGDDGIVGRFDDGREHLPEFLGPLPPGAVAEDAGHRHGWAGFALGVHLVARLTAHRVASLKARISCVGPAPAGRRVARMFRADHGAEHTVGILTRWYADLVPRHEGIGKDDRRNGRKLAGRMELDDFGSHPLPCSFRIRTVPDYRIRSRPSITACRLREVGVASSLFRHRRPALQRGGPPGFNRWLTGALATSRGLISLPIVRRELSLHRQPPRCPSAELGVAPRARKQSSPGVCRHRRLPGVTLAR